MNSAPLEEIKLLETKLTSVNLVPDLRQKAQAMIERLLTFAKSQNYSQEYDTVARYLDWLINLPWDKRSQDILSIEHAKKILEANHYGLENIKERILEYIAVASLKKNQNSLSYSKAPALLLVGLVGTGKTTMAASIAEALGRQFGRIPMGGLGEAMQLRGRPRALPAAEPGQIIKVLRRTSVKNPVILLDEIDRVTEEAKADIMGVLVEILDPEQNNRFLDHYIDYPFDLSEVFIVATANNTAGIATAVLDRLEIIEMPSYTDEQKIIIAKNYLVPRATAASGLTSKDLVFQDGVWPKIVRPLGFDAGMRTLDRTINAISRKIAKMKVEGQNTQIILTSENLKQYLPDG